MKRSGQKRKILKSKGLTHFYMTGAIPKFVRGVVDELIRQNLIIEPVGYYQEALFHELYTEIYRTYNKVCEREDIVKNY